MTKSKLSTRLVTLATVWSLVIGTGWMLPKDAEARQVRGNTRVNVNGGGNFNRGANINNRANVNRNTNINRNTNVNVNRNVNVHGGYGYHGGGYYNQNNGIGVGGAIAIGVAGMAIGSMITAASLPPSCNTVSVNGMTYQQCGNSWYQPQYSGSQVNYIVVNPPR